MSTEHFNRCGIDLLLIFDFNIRFIMHHLLVLALVSGKARGAGYSVLHSIEEHGGDLEKEDELVPPDPSLECLSSDWSTRQGLYREQKARCDSGYQRYEKRCELGKGDSVSVLEGVELEILKIITAGADGTIYSTSNEDFIVKIPKFGSVCHEKAILMALKDTEDGYFPRAYEITSPMKDNCKAQILVMEKVGDADWDSLNSSETAVSFVDVFTRLSAFVKAMKALHVAGFLHLDLHQGNVRILSSDPSYIRIIDFGRSRTSTAIGSSRESDYLRFVSSSGSVLWRIREEFDIDWLMDAVVLNFVLRPRLNCVDYDFWIWIFEKLENGSSPAVEQQIRAILVPSLPSSYEQLAGARGPGVDRLYRFPRSFRLPWIPNAFMNFPPYPDNLHPKIHEIVVAQRTVDDSYPETRPYLAFDGEIIKFGPNNDEQVLYLANKWLRSLKTDDSFTGEYQVTARVLNFENYSITYRVNCDDLNSNMISFQREYGLSSLGPKLGIGPGAIWLSPAVKLPKWRSAKLSFTLGKDEYRECANDPRSHVRFMVVDKRVTNAKYILGRDYLDKLTNLERLRLGIEVGIDLLSKLERLHDFGVVYGDVRPWTIQHFTNNGVVELGFAGLYRAFFDGEEGQGITDEFSDPCDLTHWNINDDSRVGYRDDVLNVLLLSAWMFTGEVDLSFSFDVTRTLEDIARWKGSAFVFDFPEKGYLISDIDRDNGALIKQALGLALEVARSVAAVDQKPNHPAIIEHLRSALNLLPVH